MPGLLGQNSPGHIDTRNPINWNHPLARGLAAWWLPLGSWSGGSVLRDLCRRNDGTLINGPTWAAGPNGFGALSFDGATNYVDCSSATTPGVFTLGCWVRLAASGVFGYFFGENGTFAGLRTTGIATAVSYCDGAQDIAYDPGAGWHHVVGTADGTTGTLYVDGVQRASAPSSKTGWVGHDLGARNGGSFLLACSLGDGVLYGRVLSASEIASLYDQSRRGYPDLLRRVRPWSFGASTSPPPPPSFNPGWATGATKGVLGTGVY